MSASPPFSSAVAAIVDEDSPLQPHSFSSSSHSTSAITLPGRRILCTPKLLKVISGGQLLALLITGTGVFSQLLANKSVNIPTSQSFVNYFVLSWFMLGRWWKWRKNGGSWKEKGRKEEKERSVREKRSVNGVDCQREEWKEDDPANVASSSSHQEHNHNHHHQSSCSAAALIDELDANNYIQSSSPSPSSSSSFLLVPSWKYFLLAACDVEGNFLLVKAYQYTTITSVQLLDCFTIPVVMILSRILMNTKYNRKHMIGALICLVGLTLLIASDLISGRNDSSGSDDTNSTNDRVLGDILVLIGCLFYAVSNLGQEYMVKSFDRFEFLGMLGFWGSIVSAVQMVILEREQLRQVEWNDPIILIYLLCFNVCLFFLYYFTPLLLQHSSAVFMNLSFLTSDFWSVLFAVSLFHSRLNVMYFIAFAIIIVGLILYNLAGVEASMMELMRELLSQMRREGDDVIETIEESITAFHDSRSRQLQHQHQHDAFHKHDHDHDHEHNSSVLDMLDHADDSASINTNAPTTHAHTRPTTANSHDGFHPITDLHDDIDNTVALPHRHHYQQEQHH